MTTKTKVTGWKATMTSASKGKMKYSPLRMQFRSTSFAPGSNPVGKEQFRWQYGPTDNLAVQYGKHFT